MLVIILVSVVMGIVPMLIYATFLWWLDRWEKEPLHLLAAAFIWGFVPSACIALISQQALDAPVSSVALYYGELAYDLVSGAIVAPLTEESVKAVAVLIIFVIFYREFDSLLDGIIYGSLAGFGFAAIENILYFLKVGSEKPSALVCLIFMRAFLFGLNHAFFTSLTGMGFAAARYQKNILLKILFPCLGLAGAMMAHAIHNASVSLGFIGFPLAVAADWMGIGGVLVVALVSLYHEAGWIKMQLAEEVQLGTLTADQAANASSFGNRIALNFTSLAEGLTKWWNTRRFYQTCAELAYKKHQLAQMGDEGGNQDVIYRLRGEVRMLSGEV